MNTANAATRTQSEDKAFSLGVYEGMGCSSGRSARSVRDAGGFLGTRGTRQLGRPSVATTSYSLEGCSPVELSSVSPASQINPPPGKSLKSKLELQRTSFLTSDHGNALGINLAGKLFTTVHHSAAPSSLSGDHRCPFSMVTSNCSWCLGRQDMATRFQLLFSRVGAFPPTPLQYLCTALRAQSF